MTTFKTENKYKSFESYRTFFHERYKAIVILGKTEEDKFGIEIINFENENLFKSELLDEEPDLFDK